MEGYEKIKLCRKNAGLSIQSLADISKISYTEIEQLETGVRELTGISTEIALKMFGALKVSIPDFYEEFYPYIEDVMEKQKLWSAEHPRIYDYEILKKRLRNRIHKIKERKRIDKSVSDKLLSMHKDSFAFLKERLIYGNITETDYNSSVMPLLYEIRKIMEMDDTASSVFLDALCHTEYSLADLSVFCDVSDRHLLRCKKGDSDFMKLNIACALKVCLVLKKDFYDFFGKVT